MLTWQLQKYPIKLKIMNGFICSRCLNDRIKMLYMTGSLQVVPLPSWWPKMELSNYSTTVDKIITSRQFLVFEVSKWPSWHEYCHKAQLRRFGLACLTIVAILDFQIFISQVSSLKFKLITPKPITGTISTLTMYFFSW